MQFLPFLIYFSYLFYLGHLSLLGLQRPEDRATLLLSAHSSPITRRHSRAPRQALLCMLLVSAHKKRLTQEVGHLGSLGWIPVIQVPFNSACVALQYETGTKFFHRAVPELHGIGYHKFSVQPRGIFHIFSKVSAQEQVENDKKSSVPCVLPSFFLGGIVIQMERFLLCSLVSIMNVGHGQ